MLTLWFPFDFQTVNVLKVPKSVSHWSGRKSRRSKVVHYRLVTSSVQNVSLKYLAEWTATAGTVFNLKVKKKKNLSLKRKYLTPVYGYTKCFITHLLRYDTKKDTVNVGFHCWYYFNVKRGWKLVFIFVKEKNTSQLMSLNVSYGLVQTVIYVI